MAKTKKPTMYDLDKDLQEIIEASFIDGNKRFKKRPNDKTKQPADWQALHQIDLTAALMERLSIYIVRRDHLVKDSGIKLGVENAKKQILEIIEEAKDTDLPLAHVTKKVTEL